MHIIPFELPPPKNEADFERMCAQIYGVIFNDPRAKINGRRGQAQGGVDVFVKEHGVGRVGIQCKKYTLKGVTWDDVVDEVAKADAAGTRIKRLIIATTAVNDAVLLKQVLELSDQREEEGRFTVDVDFWDDLCLHIERFKVLQESYAPNSPGAAFSRHEEMLTSIQGLLVDTLSTVSGVGSLPAAREDSQDRMITGQLDRTNDLMKAGHYRDALGHLASVGKDLGAFDNHQKARWHLQKGLCLWFIGVGDSTEAAELFLKSFELYPDDERMVAARIRGLLLLKRLDEAEVIGDEARARYPESAQVWFAWANVRMNQGRLIRMVDVPEHMKRESDTLQFVSQSELSEGNIEEALALSQKAAKSADAGFFVRETALRIAVECGAKFPVGAMAGALPDREFSALEFAVELFNPWHERLWEVQSDMLSGVVGNLGYALLMLHRFPEAVALSREAEVRGHRSEDILRVQVSALNELEREPELLSLAIPRLAEMNSATLTLVAQVLARKGDLATFQKVRDAAEARVKPEEDAQELMRVLWWDALVHADQEEVALAEIRLLDASTIDGLATACVSARVLAGAGLALEARTFTERAKLLVTDASQDGHKLMLAEHLYHSGQHADAAIWYEKLTVPGRLSDLQNRLLACYVKSHNRRKARELIARLPPDWMENDGALSLAIELGQVTADLAFLRPLVDAQMRKHPKGTASWIFKLSVSLRASTPSEFQNDLREVPEELEGPIRATAQLANMELRYGEVERGMRRLYRMLRQNLDEPEALSAYFISIVAGPGELPNMEEHLPEVGAASVVTLVDEHGHSTRLVIDPSDVGALPKRDGFSKHAAPQAAALMGCKVGDTVELPALFGEPRLYILSAIQSAYRHLLHLVMERARELGGLPHMKVLPVGTTGDRERDLAHMKAEVMRSAAMGRTLLQEYGRGHLTLLGFAALQGRDSTEIVLGWPHDAPALFTASGTVEERARAFELLQRPDAVYVIDALTLAEFVFLGVQELLGLLPRLLVSPVTKELLEHQLRQARESRSVATSAEIDGELAVIPHEKDHHKRRVEFLSAVLDALNEHCEVLPAYGEVAEDEAALADVLEPEEMETYLLSKAMGATLLTLDGRLRYLLLSAAKIEGVWPQALLLHASAIGRVSDAERSSATLRQLLTNRSYVSLYDADLLWMTHQGGAILQLGFRRIKDYLASSSSEYESMVKVMFGYLKQLTHQRIQFGAFGEIFEHLVEAALRHEKCTPDFPRQVATFCDDLTESISLPPSPYAPANAMVEETISLQRKYLGGRIQQARNRAAGPPAQRPVAVKVLFCGQVPIVVIDKSAEDVHRETEHLVRA
jgi:tetratricopeptide (TPR) repeat protein